MVSATFYPAIFDLMTYHVPHNKVVAVSFVAACLFGLLYTYLGIAFRRNSELTRANWPLLSGITAAVGFAAIRVYGVHMQPRKLLLIGGLMAVEIAVLLCLEYVAETLEIHNMKVREFAARLEKAEQNRLNAEQLVVHCKHAAIELHRILDGYADYVRECEAWNSHFDSIREKRHFHGNCRISPGAREKCRHRSGCPMKRRGVFLALLAALSAWYLSASEVALNAVLGDDSGSVPLSCRKMAEIASEQLVSESSDPKKLMIYITGDETTAFEPRRFYSVRVIRDARFVRDDDIEGPETTKAIEAECAKKLRVVGVSAIYNGIRSIVEDLEQMCHADPNCSARLTVITDGQETVVAGVRKALLGGRASAPQINNPHVQIKFCGLAETIGTFKSGVAHRTFTAPRAPLSHDRLRTVWSSIFTHPENVNFRNFCDSVESSTER